jgi:hypothetical protein
MLRAFPLLTLFMLSTVVFPVAAQTCAAVFTDTLQSSLEICSDLERNTACHGEEVVSAALRPDAPASARFDLPADTVAVDHLASVTTDVVEPNMTGGVAVMRVQANLPQTLPGQAVVMLLTGSVTVENQGAAPNPGVLLSVTAIASANLRAAPTTNAAVMAGVAPGAPLLVDGRNTAGDWFRVVRGTETYWAFGGVLDGDAGDLAALPDLTAGRAPMQAFYLRPGVGAAACEAVPNALLVQNPANARTTLQVNGVDVTIGSTVLFELTTGGLQLAVFDGDATVGNGLAVLAGQVIDAQLDASGNIQTWANVRPIPDEDRERYQVFAAASQGGTWLNYAFVIPDGVPDLIVVDDEGNDEGTFTISPDDVNTGGGSNNVGGNNDSSDDNDDDDDDGDNDDDDDGDNDDDDED